MNHLIPILLFLPLLTSAQPNLTTAEWQADLDHFHRLVVEEYPDLFRKISVTEWEREVAAVRERLPELVAHQIVAELARLVGAFEYGHTTMLTGYEQTGFRQLPLHIYKFQDGYFLEAVDMEQTDGVGARITHLEGMPIEEVVERVRPYVPAENDQFLYAYGLNRLRMPAVLHAAGVTPELRDEIRFSLERDGIQVITTVRAQEKIDHPDMYGFTRTEGNGWMSMREQFSAEYPLYLQNLESPHHFERLPDARALYIRYSQVANTATESAADFFARALATATAANTDRIVVDLRLNGGGNNFLNRAIVTQLLQHPVASREGKLFVLIGRRTFSAAQNLTNELDNYLPVIFVGEPTGENINFMGDNRPVTLPRSGLTFYLSWAWWQDKPQWLNKEWTAPHLAVELTSEQYRRGEDPVLERALTFDATGFIRDPMALLTELFVQGQFDSLGRVATQLVQDPDYAFFDFEGEFLGAGKMVMRSGRTQEAMMIYDFLYRFFPDSPAVNLALAEAMLATGKTERAKELLARTVVLDEGGALEKQAKELLRNH